MLTLKFQGVINMLQLANHFVLFSSYINDYDSGHILDMLEEIG